MANGLLNESTLSAYNPSWRDKLATWIMGNQKASPEKRQFVGGLLGSTGLGPTGAGVVDATPLGGILGAQEAEQRGDMKGMALAALPMPVKAGKAVDGLTAALKEKYPGVDFFLSQKQSGPLVVNKVVVPENMRGQGIGTEFMQDVLDHADASGVPVALSPSSDFGGNKSRLVDWYKSLGFVPNKGRKADLSISESMVREPYKP